LELEKKPHKRSSGELWSDKNGLQYARQFKEAFGDDFYIELNMPRMPELYDDKVFRITAQVGAKEGIKCVISNTCTYISREDNYLQRIMAAIDQKKTIKDPSLFYEDTEELYFKTRAELWATYHNGGYGKGLPEDSFDKFCDTSLEIAVKCDEFIPDVTMKIPDWSDVEPGKDADEELYRLVYEGLKRKNLFDDQTKFWTDGKHVTYKEQADIECDRFVSKGFASYLLITQDIINHGRSLGYPFGARGSAGGSLACYALDIHHINPQLWELSFDRFMASSRGGYMLNVSMK
jgi:DNA polymerase-3 subunit alpha